MFEQLCLAYCSEYRNVQVRRDDGKTHVTLWPRKGREFTYTFKKKGNFDRAMKLADKVCKENGLNPPDVIDQRRAVLSKRNVRSHL